MPYCDTGIHFGLHHTQADRPHNKSTYLHVALRENLSRMRDVDMHDTLCLRDSHGEGLRLNSPW